MLRNVKSFSGYSVGATDGAIGRVKDFYFDDQAWVIRYIVVDSSAWLGGRDVLISPYAISQPDWASDVLPARLTKAQVENSPGVDSDKPISRQYERRYLSYYGYPYYWSGIGLWGNNYIPGLATEDADNYRFAGYRGHLNAPSDDATGDPHLRSCDVVTGYSIRATDGDLGHVQGFLVDDVTWSIRYLIVNTSNWWVGHQVLVSPEWISRIEWDESTVDVSLDREAIKGAPAYDADAIFDREAETRVYEHYGRDSYWRAGRERVHA